MHVSHGFFGSILSDRAEEQSQLKIIEREEIEDEKNLLEADKRKNVLFDF